MNPKATTQTNQKRKKKNAKGNPFFKLTGSERRRLISYNGWRDKGDDARRIAAATGRRQSWTVVVTERAKRVLCAKSERVSRFGNLIGFMVSIQLITEAKSPFTASVPKLTLVAILRFCLLSCLIGFDSFLTEA